jgi:hypothetical protein
MVRVMSGRREMVAVILQAPQVECCPFTFFTPPPAFTAKKVWS